MTGWDEEVPTAIADDFRAIQEDMKELQEITFPQCIRPLASEGPTVCWPMLLVLGQVQGSKLHPFLCPLADGRQVIPMPPDNQQDMSGTQVQTVTESEGSGNAEGVQ